MVKGHIRSVFGTVLWLVGVLLAVGALSPVAHTARAAAQQLYITEVAVNGAEFIELYNPGPDQLALAGWQVRYRGTGANENVLKTFSEADAIPASGLIVLAQTASASLAGAHYTFSAVLHDTTGYIALYDQHGAQRDLMGWGTAAAARHGTPVTPPAAQQSVQRCLADGAVTDVIPRDNSKEFLVYEFMTPGQSINCPLVEEPPLKVPESSCLVHISEISAHPNYNNQEYIELANYSDQPASLELCKIRINGGAERTLTPGVLPPGGLHLLTYSSGAIRNSAGQVTLINSDNQELAYIYAGTLKGQVVNYGQGTSEGIVSDKPTPGAPNEYMQLTEEELVAIGGGAGLAPCPEGKYRNPLTNRCRNIESEDSNLVPCGPDQERNPETNRCRKIATSTLTPCKEGQERNPATNRCRAINGSTTTLKPCAPGQERNPETNRCRKVVGATNPATTLGQTTTAENQKSGFRTGVWLVIGTVIMGYGVYEYRHEAMRLFSKVKEYFGVLKPPG